MLDSAKIPTGLNIRQPGAKRSVAPGSLTLFLRTLKEVQQNLCALTCGTRVGVLFLGIFNPGRRASRSALGYRMLQPFRLYELQLFRLWASEWVLQ
jgi:hypothetical protein